MMTQAVATSKLQDARLVPLISDSQRRLAGSIPSIPGLVIPPDYALLAEVHFLPQ